MLSALCVRTWTPLQPLRRPSVTASPSASPRMLDFRKAMRTFVRFFALLAALSSLSLHAQVDTGTISGAVHDPSGAVITDATITVTNTADGYISTATTNHDGLYTVVD